MQTVFYTVSFISTGASATTRVFSYAHSDYYSEKLDQIIQSYDGKDIQSYCGTKTVVDCATGAHVMTVLKFAHRKPLPKRELNVTTSSIPF